MDIRYLYPHWGSETLSCRAYFHKIHQYSFDGIEINMPKDEAFQGDFKVLLDQKRLSDSTFVFVAPQVLGIQKESPQQYLDRVVNKLNFLTEFQPDFINSHTGKDHYSFSDNCRIINAIEEFSVKTGIPVYHEIHRGRFTFHSAAILQYIEMFPQLKLVGDFSHWCVVSESLLQDQEEIIEQVIPNIHHIHARIGTEQASQVNHPFAPEWSLHLEQYTKWWQRILAYHKNKSYFSITPEFGPYPYMPQSPFDQQPLSDQEEINVQMKEYLKTSLL